MPSPHLVRQPADGDLGEKKIRQMGFARRRPGAWVFSFGLHVLALILLGLFLQRLPRGIVKTVDRTGGIVLVQHQGERAEYYTADQTGDSATVETAAAQALSSPGELEIELPGSLPTVEQGGLNLEGQQADPVESLLQARGGRESGEYAVETDVFGVKAKGSRFIYVFDRSASMNALEGRPLRAAKAQLIRSLQDLGATQQFQIIFYNNEPTILNPFYPRPPRLLFADEQNRKMATTHVQGVVATGTTRHEDALLLALAMKPDVIFFLTDAEEPVMSFQELERVCRRNRFVGASIHAIQFGIGPPQGGANFLAQLARRNEGNHAYIDVTRLPARVR